MCVPEASVLCCLKDSSDHFFDKLGPHSTAVLLQQDRMDSFQIEIYINTAQTSSTAASPTQVHKPSGQHTWSCSGCSQASLQHITPEGLHYSVVRVCPWPNFTRFMQLKTRPNPENADTDSSASSFLHLVHMSSAASSSLPKCVHRPFKPNMQQPSCMGLSKHVAAAALLFALLCSKMLMIKDLTKQINACSKGG
jgi:hypothetical protein